MNRDKVMKWVKALESGRYKQGSAILADKWDNTYCCLGVAAKIHRIKHTERETNLLLSNDESLQEFAKELGLTKGRENRLTDMNDGTEGSERRSFKYIAKWIRRNILKEKGIVLKGKLA